MSEEGVSDDEQFHVSEGSQYRDYEEEEEQKEEAEDVEDIDHEQMHFDRAPDQPTENDLDMSFERDPDAITRVKAKIMWSVNRERGLNGGGAVFEDVTFSAVAMQYAAALKTGSGNEAYLRHLCDELRNDADYRICEITSSYEEDVNLNKNYQEGFFCETSYLFLEMDKEREILLDPSTTHVGIGLAANQSTIAIVLLATQRELAILQIEEVAGGIIEVKGRMLDYTVGICGVKVFNAIGGDYKEQCIALHDKIDFNRQTKEFCVYLEMDANWRERRWIQLWTRLNPDSIGYRKPRKEKDKGNSFRHLTMKLRALFTPFPDPLYMQCYQGEIDADRQRNQIVLPSLIESLIPHETNGIAEVEKPIQPEEENEGEESELESDNGERDAGREGASSNKEIKEELQLAIGEARSTYDQLLDANKMLQAKIKELRDRHGLLVDKTSEASMNQHKYLNILAQVHQTRVQLQQTQNKYNRMSLELQNKLNDKQSKCNDIRNAFKDLKRQVAKKASYTRSELPIKQNKIDEWENRESQITQTLQNLRLQILQARNTYAKNLKILKKKEQLAQGLHLIDFEQLKIENQTLNEKIEERNEDLHKLKKKTTSMVQILTHTREKLMFVDKSMKSLGKESGNLEKTIQGLRAEINATKENCQKLRLEIQDAKQETEIVNSQELVVDFKKRAQNINRIEEDIAHALAKEKQMKTIIDMYQRKIRKEGIVK